jgi:hypothetical protein
MPRPSFQFYPADVRNNHKLSFCSWGAKGAMFFTLCLLHDGEQYGVTRHTLEEMAHAIGCPIELMRELAERGVISGCDSGDHGGYVFRPRHAGKLGDPVCGVAPCEGPIWYNLRMVRDEHARQVRASKGVAASEAKRNAAGYPARNEAGLGDKDTFGEAFKGGFGGYLGTESDAAFGETFGPPPSSTSSSSNKHQLPEAQGAPVPENFQVSQITAIWAKRSGIEDLEAWREHFVLTSRAHGIAYINPDAGFCAFIKKERAAGRGPLGRT